MKQVGAPKTYAGSTEKQYRDKEELRVQKKNYRTSEVEGTLNDLVQTFIFPDEKNQAPEKSTDLFKVNQPLSGRTENKNQENK